MSFPCTQYSRREFLSRVAAAGAACGASAAWGAEPNGRRPNLVFLLTDDQRADMMGCAGHPVLQTPHMDALARDGVRFENAFVTTAICAASRASLITGLHERTHRFTFGTPPIAPEFWDIGYPAVLRRDGYRTGFIGKFGMGTGTPPRELFDTFVPLNRNPYMKKQPDGTERHLTDIAGDEAVRFVEANAGGDQPFCLSVSFNAPHAEDSDPRQYFWPEAVDSLYRDVTLPPVPKTDPAIFEAQPPFMQDSMNRIRWRWRFDEPAKATEMIKGYYRMISGIDRVVGRIRDALRTAGVADDTVVILMGDNGYFIGERGFAGKWTGHEESLRVPLLIADPRAPAAARNRVVSAMALNIDVPATLIDLAGSTVPERMQGRSLRPFLEGKTPADWRTEFFCEHLFENKDIPKYEGVRTETVKYMRWFEQEPVFEELYDLRTDPEELRNLAGVAAHASLLADMRRRCDRWRDALGGPYVSRPRRAPDAEPRGPAAVPGVKGRAARFDGRASLLAGAVPAVPAAGSLSWAFHVRIDPNTRPSGVIVGNRRTPGEADKLTFMKVTPETVQFFNGGGRSLRLRHGLPVGEWVHVAVVKSGETVTVWRDGVAGARGSVPFDMPELPLYLGGDPVAGEMASCTVDEMMLFDRALDEAEIGALARGSDLPSGRILHLPLEGAPWVAR